MAHLTELQIEKIKEHMLSEEDALKIKFKARKTQFDTMKVLHSEVEAYDNSSLKFEIMAKQLYVASQRVL